MEPINIGEYISCLCVSPYTGGGGGNPFLIANLCMCKCLSVSVCVCVCVCDSDLLLQASSHCVLGLID